MGGIQGGVWLTKREQEAVLTRGYRGRDLPRGNRVGLTKREQGGAYQEGTGRGLPRGNRAGLTKRERGLPRGNRAGLTKREQGNIIVEISNVDQKKRCTVEGRGTRICHHHLGEGHGRGKGRG